MHEFKKIGSDTEESEKFPSQNRSWGVNFWKSGGKFQKKWSWGRTTIREGRVVINIWHKFTRIIRISMQHILIGL